MNVLGSLSTCRIPSIDPGNSIVNSGVNVNFGGEGDKLVARVNKIALLCFLAAGAAIAGAATLYFRGNSAYAIAGAAITSLIAGGVGISFQDKSSSDYGRRQVMRCRSKHYDAYTATLPQPETRDIGIQGGRETYDRSVETDAIINNSTIGKTETLGQVLKPLVQEGLTAFKADMDLEGVNQKLVKLCKNYDEELVVNIQRWSHGVQLVIKNGNISDEELRGILKESLALADGLKILGICFENCHQLTGEGLDILQKADQVMRVAFFQCSKIYSQALADSLGSSKVARLNIIKCAGVDPDSLTQLRKSILVKVDHQCNKEERYSQLIDAMRDAKRCSTLEIFKDTYDQIVTEHGMALRYKDKWEFQGSNLQLWYYDVVFEAFKQVGSGVRTLKLEGDDITDEVIACLANKGLPIETLDLEGCQNLTFKALLYLKEMMPPLRILSLKKCIQFNNDQIEDYFNWLRSKAEKYNWTLDIYQYDSSRKSLGVNQGPVVPTVRLGDIEAIQANRYTPRSVRKSVR
ncbi:MAG: hypothetical protein ACQEP8_03200 [Chlamydiota bacterium]